MARRRKIESFAFEPGRRLAGKYEIVRFLGKGWEAEVYEVVETLTGVTRAAKFFFPDRNPRDRAVRFYARKLERLRHCDIVIQYFHSESFWHRGEQVTFLVSELVEGELLSRLVAAQPGKKMKPFEAMHLLHALAKGLEQVHHKREYHGDIHDDNVLVQRRGAFFEVKMIDLFPLGRPDRTKIADDVVQLVRLFYDAIGGRAVYAKQPPEVKAICLGLRRDLIIRRFPTAGHLRAWLESFSWS